MGNFTYAIFTARKNRAQLGAKITNVKSRTNPEQSYIQDWFLEQQTKTVLENRELRSPYVESPTAEICRAFEAKTFYNASRVSYTETQIF